MKSKSIKTDKENISSEIDKHLYNNESQDEMCSFEETSGGVHTLESLNVNTLLGPSSKQKVDLSRQNYFTCFYTNATSLNNKFDEFIEEIRET